MWQGDEASSTKQIALCILYRVVQWFRSADSPENRRTMTRMSTRCPISPAYTSLGDFQTFLAYSVAACVWQLCPMHARCKYSPLISFVIYWAKSETILTPPPTSGNTLLGVGGVLKRRRIKLLLRASRYKPPSHSP